MQCTVPNDEIAIPSLLPLLHDYTTTSNYYSSCSWNALGIIIIKVERPEREIISFSKLKLVHLELEQRRAFPFSFKRMKRTFASVRRECATSWAVLTPPFSSSYCSSTHTICAKLNIIIKTECRMFLPL